MRFLGISVIVAAVGLIICCAYMLMCMYKVFDDQGNVDLIDWVVFISAIIAGLFLIYCGYSWSKM